MIMSYMSEISIMIQDAAELGISLELSDFRTLNRRLMIDGMDSNDWFDMVIAQQDAHDTLTQDHC